MNIFEIASQKQFRYVSTKGEITTEQLWELPLKAGSGFDLNSVAIQVNNQLKAITSESFVDVSPTAGKADLETKLEIVKHIIAVRQAAIAARLEAADKAAKREKLRQALANQEDNALAKMTPEEILAELAKLD